MLVPDLSITNHTVRAAALNSHTKEFVKYFLDNGFILSKTRLLLVLSLWEDVREENPGLFKALVKHGEDIGCTSHDFFNAYIRGSGSQFYLDFMLEKYEPLSLNSRLS